MIVRPILLAALAVALAGCSAGTTSTPNPSAATPIEQVEPTAAPAVPLSVDGVPMDLVGKTVAQAKLEVQGLGKRLDLADMEMHNPGNAYDPNFSQDDEWYVEEIPAPLFQDGVLRVFISRTRPTEMTMLPSGTHSYSVGTVWQAGIEPGTYRTSSRGDGAGSCLWIRSSHQAPGLQGSFVSAEPSPSQVLSKGSISNTGTVTITPQDHTFWYQNCGEWSRVS